jgi:hypothetical protein
MTPQGQAAIIPNATNVLAVSCYQTVGGQFIDVGISSQTLLANAYTPPTDYMGYWPLDASSGTVAVDASGNGNNGTVGGASWSPSGKINNCLNFDGTDDYVQVNNTISNDFSVAFWVNTTQTAATGQWWQGKSLVNGFVGQNTNDFGTSLSGGNFAFGTGRPDTTIISTVPINDGAWHQCVATRVQSSGALNIYVDGVWQSAGTGGTNSLTAPAFLRFGSSLSGSNFFFGSLDEIKIFNRVLGNNEITALYLNSAIPPAPPTNLVVTAGNGQVSMSWFVSLWATGYMVGRSTTSGGPYTVMATTTANAYTDTNVANGTTYYYVVSSINSAGTGANSSEIVATPGNLSTWFKADAITGIPSGASVSTWSDKSGNSNNATQTSAGQQPVYVTSAMNGMPVVRFNSTNSAFLAFNRPVQDDFTIIIVYQSAQTNQGAGTQFYYGAGLVNGDQPGAQNDFGTALNAKGQVIVGTGNPDTSIVSGNGYNDGKPHIATFERTESTGAIALFVNGTQVATGTGSTSPLTAPPTLDLGAVPSGGGFFSGDIAEVKIFNSVLSGNDRIAEENSLKCKYFLSGGSVPATPTGLSAMAANTQIVLSWNPVAGANSYNLYRSTNGAAYALITNTVTAGATDPSPVVGKTNYYQVAALDGCGPSANSAEVSIFLPLPVLAANFNAVSNTLSITWPAAYDWLLYSATNLVAPAIWLPVTNTVGSNNNGQFEVSVPIGSGAEFFRLSAP